MAFQNPSDSTEILYGASGDVRDEINSHVLASTAGHYADEKEIPGALIIKSLVKATHLVNSYLEPVYPDKLPVTVAGDVPKMLDDIASDIATYYVWRSSVAKLGRIPDDKRRDYFDDYVSAEDGKLTKISEKKMQLPEWTADSPADAAQTRSTGRHPIFDIDNETSQGPDPRLLDDIADERNV